MSKIIYFNSHEQIDKDIIEALQKLGHKVTLVESLDIKETADLFLFSQTIISTDNLPSFLNRQIALQKTLTSMKCKKVFWFTDKVMGLGSDLLETIIPLVDYVFLNDDTWIRRHDYENVYPLHLGASEIPEGKYEQKYSVDVAFNGNIYQPIVQWIDELKKVFGSKFKLYDVHGKDFADLCASAKIIISSRFLFSDFYWDDKIYQTLACGGFMIYPRVYGLELKDVQHYINYNSFPELVDTIKWFLQHPAERDAIASRGRTEVLKNYTYKNRLKELLLRVEGKAPDNAQSSKIEESYLEMDGHQFLIPNPDLPLVKDKEEYSDINYVMDDMAKQPYGMWEPNTTKVVKDNLKTGDVAIDIGASVGYFTLLFARQVRKTGKVFSFEATPYRFAYMCRNVEINGYKDRVFPFNLAALDKKEKVPMPPQKKNFIIQGVPIDDILEENNVDRVDFIKIDVDGNELKVLRGLERTFKKNKDLKMVFEYDPKLIKAQGEDPKEVMELLEQYFDYSVIQGDYGDERGLWNFYCVRKRDEKS